MLIVHTGFSAPASHFPAWFEKKPTNIRQRLEPRLLQAPSGSLCGMSRVHATALCCSSDPRHVESSLTGEQIVTLHQQPRSGSSFWLCAAPLQLSFLHLRVVLIADFLNFITAWPRPRWQRLRQPTTCAGVHVLCPPCFIWAPASLSSPTRIQ